MEWFWLLFLIILLQPMVKQRFLELSRKRQIARIERAHRSRVILLVHRQETMRLLGIPLFRFIDVQDSEEVMRAIHMTDPEMPLELILHTPGGLVLASTQIARAIQRHKGPVTVYVPHYAMSGGTLIALAADRIVMSPSAVLGPVDPQLGQYPAASVLRAVERKPVAEVEDRTLILAEEGRKALYQIRETVRQLLAKNYPADTADELAGLLSEGTWTHDFPIDYEQAGKLGLHVSDDIPDAVLHLMTLYPQPVRHAEGVEYLPVPRRRPGGERPGQGG